MKIRDLTVLVGVILVILMLVIPLPGGILSVLVLVNITISLMVILVAMNTTDVLEFSVFPTETCCARLISAIPFRSRSAPRKMTADGRTRAGPGRERP